MSSLLKIAILFPSVWLFNISFTSPNPPPDGSERVYSAWYEYICPNIFPILYKMIGLDASTLQLSASIPCAAELAVVFAIHTTSKLYSVVFSRLILPGQLPSSNINRYFIAGSILITVSGLGRLWCYHTLGRYFTAELAIQKDHELVTIGPYAIVRHPSYLCAALSSFGMSLLIAGPGSFMRQCGWLDTTLGSLFIGAWGVQSVLLLAVCCVRCPREDALLRERFREEWVRYSERVRYRMIPGVY